MNKVWCEFHQIEHDLELVERFAAKVGHAQCPIAAAMEMQSGVFSLQPTYEIIPRMPTETVRWPMNIDLMVTKLPSTEKEGYTQGLVGYIANRCYQNMNANSLAYVIVSSFKEEKRRPFKVVEIFEQAGFTFVDTIIWEKNKYTPTQGGKRLNNVYDFIFQFAKGDNYHLDRESIAHLRKDGAGDYLCAGNIWRIKVDEKDSLPKELVDCILKLSNLLPDSTIVDPFMDTGATLKAALEGQHSFWGCEPDPLKFKRCTKVVKEYRSSLNQQEEAVNESK
jgi:DNA modification methylase